MKVKFKEWTKGYDHLSVFHLHKVSYSPVSFVDRIAVRRAKNNFFSLPSFRCTQSLFLLCRLSQVLTVSQKEIKKCVNSERFLLETYCVHLPDENLNVFNKSTCEKDDVSLKILRHFHPALLTYIHVIPAKTIGDGRCLYRAVSRAKTGSEVHNVLLRLLTDGLTTIVKPLGKKLGQRKRKVNERTQTIKKHKS